LRKYVIISWNKFFIIKFSITLNIKLIKKNKTKIVLNFNHSKKEISFLFIPPPLSLQFFCFWKCLSMCILYRLFLTRINEQVSPSFSRMNHRKRFYVTKVLVWKSWQPDILNLKKGGFTSRKLWNSSNWINNQKNLLE
jgi:hypothetical protein